jgi:hypothetical protein
MRARRLGERLQREPRQGQQRQGGRIDIGDLARDQFDLDVAERLGAPAGPDLAPIDRKFQDRAADRQRHRRALEIDGEDLGELAEPLRGESTPGQCRGLVPVIQHRSAGFRGTAPLAAHDRRVAGRRRGLEGLDRPPALLPQAKHRPGALQIERGGVEIAGAQPLPPGRARRQRRQFGRGEQPCGILGRRAQGEFDLLGSVFHSSPRGRGGN